MGPMAGPVAARVRRDSRGQGSTEFLGILVLGAILVSALVFAVTQSSTPVAQTVRTKLCEITTAGQGSCGGAPNAPTSPSDDGIPTYADTSLTPLDRATSGQYDALGDSFSSGEGGSKYEPGTDTNKESEEEYYWATHDKDGNRTVPYSPYVPVVDKDPYSNTCHRSTDAYPQRVNSSFTFQGGYSFSACSGAVTADFSRPNGYNPDNPASGNDGEEPQLDHLDANTSLVTFSIGGNDAKFADTLSGCIVAGLNPFDSCTDGDEKQAVEDNIDTAIANLDKLLPSVRDAAPNARILVLGYPRFFPEERRGAWDDGTQIDPDDITFINAKIKEMDDRIAALVAERGGAANGFEYVDVYDAFKGCEIGTDSPCMNNIEIRFSGGNIDKNGSYHPNDRGQGRLAEIVEDQVTNGG